MLSGLDVVHAAVLAERGCVVTSAQQLTMDAGTARQTETSAVFIVQLECLQCVF